MSAQRLCPAAPAAIAAPAADRGPLGTRSAGALVRLAGSHRARAVALGWVAAAAAVTAHVVSPSRDRWLPTCPFHELTGLWCPVCGSTRAACALARGDVWDAVRHNALFLPALLLVVWVWAAYALRSFAPEGADRAWARSPLRLLRRPWWLVVVVVGFFIARNVPGVPEHLLST